MAITISNLRFSPYTQKDAYKPIFGEALVFDFTIAGNQAGDKYCLGLDYEKVVYPPSRPLCAYTEQYTLNGTTLTMSLALNTARFRDWVCKLKKPTTITIQLMRIRGSKQETLLLDDLLALPSICDGANVVCEGDPLAQLLDAKIDCPAEEGAAGQILSIGENGNTVWIDEPKQEQADWQESDSDSPAFIQHKPTIPAAQVQADWTEEDSFAKSFIQHKPTAADLQANWNEIDATSPQYIQNKPNIVEPYSLPIVSGNANWSGSSVLNWNDTDIIANKRKIVYVYSGNTNINFPTLVSNVTVNEVWTCEFWIDVPVFGTTVSTITVPNTWDVIGDFPTTLESDELKNSIYVFVGRFIPNSYGDTYCQLAYSYKWLTSWNYIG